MRLANTLFTRINQLTTAPQQDEEPFSSFINPCFFLSPSPAVCVCVCGLLPTVLLTRNKGEKTSSVCAMAHCVAGKVVDPL